MAKYTIELREFVNNPSIDIFDFNYPFYDESEKEKFEELFIQHFYFREICAETVGRWKIYLNDFFQTHIPKYNMLANTAKMEYDLKINYDMTEETTKNISGNNSQNLTGSNSNSITVTDTGTITDNGQNVNVSTSTGTNTITDSFTQNTTKTHTDDIDVENDHRKIEPSQSEFASLNLDKWATEVDKNNQITESTIVDTDTGTTTNTHTENLSNPTGYTTDIDNIKTLNTTNTNVGSGTNDTALTALNNETETLAKRTFGDLSVRTMPEAILTHLKLQDILTTINLQFFEEAEILFLQIY